MNIGLYFGSFNPIHTGHLVIANHLLNETDIEKIWFVVSPQNPFKKKDNLLNEYHRLQLVRLATEDDTRMKASDIEFGLPQPSYTINTLVFLKEKYPQHRFCIIMGSDSYQNIGKWKNAELILKDYELFIYQRPGFDTKGPVPKNIHVLQAPSIFISATEIRGLIRRGKSARYLVPDKVLEEIGRGGYYKK
jgi:nicotinate-nucleotide adenylyltransferase